MGRITLIAQLQSNIQAGLRAISGATQATGAAIQGMGRRANAAAAGLNAMGGALGTAQQRAAAAAAAMANLTAQQHQHGITTSRLIIMMVKFGIILNALRLVTSPLGWMTDGIKSAVTLERGLRNVVGMLANAGDDSATLDMRFRSLMGSATMIQVRYGQTAENTITGLYKIASVVDALNFTGVRSEVDRVSFSIDYLGNIASRAAVGGMTDVGTAADALTATLTGLNLPLIHANEVSDILFQTVRLGKAEFEDAARDVGILSGAFSAITKQGREMAMLQETGGLYAFFSTFLPPEEARVSLQRMGLFLTGESAAAQQLATQINEISGGTVQLTAAAVREKGLMETFRSIAGFMDPNNPLLAGAVAERIGRRPTEEEMGGIRFRMLAKIFDDARAARAALRVLSTDGTASLDKITEGMEGFGGATDRAMGEGQKSLAVRFQQLQMAIQATARSLTEANMGGLGDMFGGITERLRMLLQRPAFKESGMLGKLGFIFGDLYRAFSEWYYTGGGQGQIKQMATRIGSDMGHFVMGVLGLNIKGAAEDGKFKNAWYDAGRSAASEFLRGLWEAMNPTSGPNTTPIIGGLQNFIARGSGGPVTRGILGIAAARGLGGGGAAQALTGTVAAANDNVLGLALQGLGLWAMYKGLRGGSAGGFGGMGTGLTGLTNRMKASPLAGSLGSIFNQASRTTAGTAVGVAGLNVLQRFPWLARLAGRVPVAGAGITAGLDLMGGQDLPYAIGHGLFTAGGAALLGAAGLIPAIATAGLGTPVAIAGALAGGAGGSHLFQSIFGPGRTNQVAAAGPAPNASVIDEYFNSRQQAQGGGVTIFMPIEKLADTITAGTPEEARQMAETFFDTFVASLERAVGNTSSVRGGGGEALLTP